MTFVSTLVVASTLAGQGQVGSRPIAYSSFKHGKFYFHVVQADLASGRVAARTVHSPRLTSPWSLVAQRQPAVAITGTFFAPGSGYPVADVLVNGKLVARGDRGSALGVDWFGKVQIFDTKFRQKYNWEPYRWALRGMVRVVTNGKVRPNPKAQRFRDRRIWSRASRTGVGLTKNGKLVLMATRSNVTLSEFGKAMVAQGVKDAVSLDGGSSTCLYYRGSMVIPTARRLSNMLVLSERPIE